MLLAACGDDLASTGDEAKALWTEVVQAHAERAVLVEPLSRRLAELTPEETETVTALEQARAQVAVLQPSAGTVHDPAAFDTYEKAEALLSRALSRVRPALARQPRVAADPELADMLARLEKAEERLAEARRGYMQAAGRYNAELRNAPGRWWAALFHPRVEPLQNFTLEMPSKRGAAEP